VTLLDRLKLAWAGAEPKSRAVLGDLAKRVGVANLARLAQESSALLDNRDGNAQAVVHHAVRAMVIRQARRFGHELSITDADLVASFLLSTPEPS